LKQGDPEGFNPDQIETLEVVLKYYGDKEPYELRDSSHHEAPWRIARGDLPEDAPGDAIITKESMGSYYGSL